MTLRGAQASSKSTTHHFGGTAEATFKQPGQYPGTGQRQITVTVSSPLRRARAVIHRLNQ